MDISYLDLDDCSNESNMQYQISLDSTVSFYFPIIIKITEPLLRHTTFFIKSTKAKISLVNTFIKLPFKLSVALVIS